MLRELNQQQLRNVIGGALTQLPKDSVQTIYVDKDGQIICGSLPVTYARLEPAFPKPSPTNPRPKPLEPIA